MCRKVTMIAVGWIVQLGGGLRQPHSWRAKVTLANFLSAPITRALQGAQRGI